MKFLNQKKLALVLLTTVTIGTSYAFPPEPPITTKIIVTNQTAANIAWQYQDTTCYATKTQGAFPGKVVTHITTIHCPFEAEGNLVFQGVGVVSVAYSPCSVTSQTSPYTITAQPNGGICNITIK